MCSDEDCVCTAMKFCLVINPKSHPVRNFGVGKEMANPPTVSIRALGNGACLFNTFSLLLCGQDKYSAIIQHVICKYICNPVKHNFLSPYFPTAYKPGKEYLRGQNMHTFTTWGTKVEIVAFAQLSGFDVKVVTLQKQWALFSHDPVKGESSSKCFYLSNISRDYFDPIFEA